MSDVSVGVIGQVYEDRKTKRTGVLVGRDEVRKTLTFEDSEGKQFVISNSTFRSGWRKVIAEAETVKAEEEPVEVEAPVMVEPVEDADFVMPAPEFANDQEAIDDFIKTLSEHRKVDVQILLDRLSLVIDDVEVLTAQKNEYFTHIECLPDMFTYSPFKYSNDNFHVDETKTMSVSFDTTITAFGVMLQILKEAAADINLYAYTEEE